MPSLADPLVSVVIPTRQRPESLLRLLASLARQSRAPHETLVMDAGTPGMDVRAIEDEFPTLHIRHFPCAPSVCRQRNFGIAEARGPLILLADDDVEFPENYLDVLTAHMRSHPDEGAVSGILHEMKRGRLLVPDRIPVSTPALLWGWVFQTTIWGTISPPRSSAAGRRPSSFLRRYYGRRGNTFSSAGWPLLTQTESECFRTSVYGLGGALVLREWLLASRYDELLDEHGIGDNYGVALGFPREQPITVVTSVAFLHHRESRNRVPPPVAYARRVYALDHFMARDRRFRLVNRVALRWSILGHFLYYVATGALQLALISCMVLLRLMTWKNPLPDAAAQPRNDGNPATR